MYEAIVARVRYHIQKANFMGLKDAESTLLLGEAADAIEELRKKVDQQRENLIALMNSKPKWISVEDELPEPETVVLAAFDDGEICTLWQEWKNMTEADKFEYAATDWHLQHVTHWMPLPEPPKEE